MANWVGGSFVYRDKKGDKDGRTPIQVVPVAQQREAIKFVLENAFRDDAYGLNPDMLNHMTVDKWIDDGFLAAFIDPTWPVHDKIMGVQASVLLTCQRCLGPLRRVLESTSRLAFVASDEVPVPAEREAVACDPHRLDLAALVEDELLLALPLIARHAPGEACTLPDAAAAQVVTDEPGATRRPFAGLKDLLKH